MAKKQQHGVKAERKAAKRMGGRTTPGSGAKVHSKGDIRTCQFCIESKSTVKDSLSVKKAWLEKITKEALDAGKDPALIIQVVDALGSPVKNGSWVAVPERVFHELFR